MKDRLTVGIITKPQGIRGEVKVQPLTSDITRFERLKEVFIDDAPEKTRVLSARISGGDVFLYLQGASDRNAAERLRGKQLLVERADAEKPDDRFFIADLLDCDVFVDGKLLGHMYDILQNTATDVYWVRPAFDRKGVLFPVIDGVIVSTDVEGCRIDVDGKAFHSLASFED